MPIYEYECLECGIHFDKFQRLDDPEPASCPNGHPRIHRLLSRPAIIFKGSGFYVTDHGRNGSGKSSRSRRLDKETTTASNTEAKQDTSS
jgi:putative FmdB family regulatory protein